MVDGSGWVRVERWVRRVQEAALWGIWERRQREVNAFLCDQFFKFFGGDGYRLLIVKDSIAVTIKQEFGLTIDY
jgi:hypothetical protein